MFEEFDKSELNNLVKLYMSTKKELDNATIRTEHIDEDEFNEKVYDLTIMVEETKSEIIEYVERYESNVKALRTAYGGIAYKLFEEA